MKYWLSWLLVHPNVWLINMVSEFLFRHPGCHFWTHKDGHLWQKCPSAYYVMSYNIYFATSDIFHWRLQMWILTGGEDILLKVRWPSGSSSSASPLPTPQKSFLQAPFFGSTLQTKIPPYPHLKVYCLYAKSCPSANPYCILLWSFGTFSQK